MTEIDKKAIEEMAHDLCGRCQDGICVVDGKPCNLDLDCTCQINAATLYNAGYRKQSEGEWKIKSEIYQMFEDADEELYVECPFCGRTFWVPFEFDDQKTFEYAREHYPYCNCGAKMKGGE